MAMMAATISSLASFIGVERAVRVDVPPARSAPGAAWQHPATSRSPHQRKETRDHPTGGDATALASRQTPFGSGTRRGLFRIDVQKQRNSPPTVSWKQNGENNTHLDDCHRCRPTGVLDRYHHTLELDVAVGVARISWQAPTTPAAGPATLQRYLRIGPQPKTIAVIIRRIRRVTAGHNGDVGRGDFAGFSSRQQRIGTRRNLTRSRRMRSSPNRCAVRSRHSAMAFDAAF
jgi:hypothetical protein